MKIKQKLRHLLTTPFKILLRDPEVGKLIWEIVNRPGNVESTKAENIQHQLYKNAAEETAKYVFQKMPDVQSLPTRNGLLELSLSKAKKDGLFLEFGVATGASINFIAERVKGIVHGFDSFQGLPESWFDKTPEGSFSTGGKLPVVRDNVKLHVGLFDQTLPKFNEQCQSQEQIAFMHVDCDLYSSAKIIFNVFGKRIQSGTIIQFDEYFNYPGWKEHEYKAFQEFTLANNITYKYLGYNRCGYSAAVMIT